MPCGIGEIIGGIEGGRMLEDIDGRNIGSRAGIELVRALLACGSPGDDKLGFLYCAMALLQNRSIGGLPPA